MSDTLDVVVDLDPIDGEPIEAETVAFAHMMNKLLEEGKIEARFRDDGEIGFWPGPNAE